MASRDATRGWTLRRRSRPARAQATRRGAYARDPRPACDEFHQRRGLTAAWRPTGLAWTPSSLGVSFISVPSSSGIVLRRKRRLRALHVPRISVPSSSGIVLRHPPFVRTSQRVLYYFSPLLIGDRSATATGRPRSGRVNRFQSPPHRGSFCDRPPNSRKSGDFSLPQDP